MRHTQDQQRSLLASLPNRLPIATAVRFVFWMSATALKDPDYRMYITSSNSDSLAEVGSQNKKVFERNSSIRVEVAVL